MKTAAYESLHVIAQATDQITEHIERLKTAGDLNPPLADIHKLIIQQLRAEINSFVTLRLHEGESKDAHQIEQERIRQEEQLGTA